MWVVLSYEKNKQTALKQTNKHLEDKNKSGSVGSDFSAKGLLWRGLKLFIFPDAEVRMDYASLHVCLIIFSDLRLFQLGIWDMKPASVF